MGTLDKQSRVINFRFTKLGRELLARNKIDFSYYRFFDDGVDYSQGDEAIVNDTLTTETPARAEYVCKRPLSTINPDDTHMKPYMYVTKNDVTLRKQQQEGSLLSEISLVGVVDVYVEEEVDQFETEEPIYVTAEDLGLYAWLPVVGSLDFVEETGEITSEEYPEDTIEEPPKAAPLNYVSVKSISDDEEIGFELVGADVQSGFRVEVFYSGSASEFSGSNIIKLTEHGIHPLYSSQYPSDVSVPVDIQGGYDRWFSIKAKSIDD